MMIYDYNYRLFISVFVLCMIKLISITSLPEDEQTSKHGGGGRYNAILEFKGEQIKKERKKKKK
jgi:hypothetical protein